MSFMGLVKNMELNWAEADGKAFPAINKIITTPILAYPNPSKPFVLHMDALNVSIREVLSQDFNGKKIVITCGSKTLTKAKKRYCITCRELVSVAHLSRLP